MFGGAVYSCVMRALACSLLLSICLVAQSHEAPRLFPIPTGLGRTWPDAVLSDSEKSLLREAVEPDLRDLEQYCEGKSRFGLIKTGIKLGALGKGVVVSARGSCTCGATGNCPIYVYVREKDRYRQVLRGEPYSWAFAVLDSKTGVPGIVLAAHSSAFEQQLTKYEYVADGFVPQACETLTAKGAAPPKSWWDPNEVLVQPCETH